ncbi:lysophospholipid acyltransferase 5 isoform X2 [Anabrus simplex]|uniref:lysophospholipid acyltransferase 5 isoform X2 n=1 Tax=Anabrus simplex TaxID=316456 RepID=UPI0035A26DA9
MAAETMFHDSYLGQLANYLGATEPALRLLLSILIGYPLALVHRYTLYGKGSTLQHIFFIVSGLSIGYFNYGTEVLHSTASVLVVYAILVLAGGTAASVLLVFTFSMGYLLMGYYMTGTETYDIKWSMPQCVLTLRLIGLAFDVYDGRKPILNESGLPSCLYAALKRGSLGFVYLGIYQLGTSFLPDSYLLSQTYDILPFWKKCIFLGLWGKITLYKYISCWLISEGVCISTGLTYNGKSKEGEALWDGCANVKLRVFEGASKFGHYITSFNINTNHWVAQYIYKRLKFLGNRYLSQASALLFLAIWHGLHSGYYMCFFMEFVVIKLEKDVENMLLKNENLRTFLEQSWMVPVIWIILKLYTWVFMGYCLVPFALLSFPRWWQVYKSVYFIGHIVFALWPFYYPAVKLLLSSKSLKRHSE